MCDSPDPLRGLSRVELPKAIPNDSSSDVNAAMVTARWRFEVAFCESLRSGLIARHRSRNGSRLGILVLNESQRIIFDRSSPHLKAATATVPTSGLFVFNSNFFRANARAGPGSLMPQRLIPPLPH